MEAEAVNIYFVADENMSTLLDFTYKSVYRAEDGKTAGIKLSWKRWQGCIFKNARRGWL